MKTQLRLSAIATTVLYSTLFGQTPPQLAPERTVLKPKPALAKMFVGMAEAVTALPTSSNPVEPTPGKPMRQTGGTCTAAAARGFLDCDVPKPKYNLGADWVLPIYFWATTHDSFPDNDNDIDGGSDSWTVGKRLKQLGYIEKNPDSLLWAGEILKHIQTVGPGVMSSLWFRSMDQPNPETGEVTVTPNTGSRGGHAYLMYKWRRAERVKARNGKWLDLPERVYCQQTWLDYMPFDNLPEGPQIFWVSMEGYKRIVNAGRGTLWIAPKAKPKVDDKKSAGRIDPDRDTLPVVSAGDLFETAALSA